jgi:methionyl-tRNA synthetase
MEQFLIQNQWLILLAILWVLPWKGVALWKSARLNSKPWFVVLFLVNTIGILEILYIYIFSKRSYCPSKLVSQSPPESKQQLADNSQ